MTHGQIDAAKMKRFYGSNAVRAMEVEVQTRTERLKSLNAALRFSEQNNMPALATRVRSEIKDVENAND
jgi:hypothetical protein